MLRAVLVQGVLPPFHKPLDAGRTGAEQLVPCSVRSFQRSAWALYWRSIRSSRRRLLGGSRPFDPNHTVSNGCVVKPGTGHLAARGRARAEPAAPAFVTGAMDCRMKASDQAECADRRGARRQSQRENLNADAQQMDAGHAHGTRANASARLIRIGRSDLAVQRPPASGPSACSCVHLPCICVKILACFAARRTAPLGRPARTRHPGRSHLSNLVTPEYKRAALGSPGDKQAFNTDCTEKKVKPRIYTEKGCVEHPAHVVGMI